MAKDYEEMRYEMRNYSTKFSKCPEKDFDVGYRCAVYDGGSWWRAEVLCLDNFPTCGVLFIDMSYLCNIYDSSSPLTSWTFDCVNLTKTQGFHLANNVGPLRAGKNGISHCGNVY